MLVAAPDGAPRGAIVVLGELFGITDLVEEALATLTGAGYTAAAPDLYWRAEPRLALGYDDTGRARGFDLLGRLDPDAVVADIDQVQNLLAGRTGGPSALVGFSTGGYLGLLAATRLPFDVVGAVYPGWTLNGGAPVAGPHGGPAPLERAERLRGTLVLVAAGSRDHLMAADLDGIRSKLAGAGVEHRVLTIDGAAHGYACRGRPETFHADGTRRTWEFLLDGLNGRGRGPTGT
jgi:carboxymethylenebutenolidase